MRSCDDRRPTGRRERKVGEALRHWKMDLAAALEYEPPQGTSSH